MAMSAEMEQMISVVNKYAGRVIGVGHNYYVEPDIPEKVAKKLMKNFDRNLPINSLIAFFDTSLLGTSSSGLLLTVDGFYHKFITKPVYIAYQDITDMHIDGEYLNVSYLDNCGLQGHVSSYAIIDSFTANLLLEMITALKGIDALQGQSIGKSSGTVKDKPIPEEMKNKCSVIIHGASVACGGVGTGLAQLPGSDNAVIVPIQIAMIVSLGGVFNLNITESAAKSILASAAATVTGRTVSQFLVGWIPVIGNAINTATAAGVTEAIGWLAANNFYQRYLQDMEKGRYEGAKAGYKEASDEYERKMRQQADDFIKQRRDFQKERDAYEELIKEYEAYIDKLERERAAYEHIADLKREYAQLKNLLPA